MSAAMLAVYEATNITENPPQTFIKNLFGHDLGALKATKWPHNKPHMTQRADAIEKFLLLCLPQGFKPKGLSHS